MSTAGELGESVGCEVLVVRIIQRPLALTLQKSRVENIAAADTAVQTVFEAVVAASLHDEF